MSDNLDKHIKKLMDEHTVSFNEAHWESLTDRLDLEFGDIGNLEDAVRFDTEIQRTLENHQVPVQWNHWVRLRERLDLEDARVRKVYISKVLEVVIFALLLLFFLQVYQTRKSYSSHDSDTHAPSAHIEQGLLAPLGIAHATENNPSAEDAAFSQVTLSDDASVDPMTAVAETTPNTSNGEIQAAQNRNSRTPESVQDIPVQEAALTIPPSPVQRSGQLPASIHIQDIVPVALQIEDREARPSFIEWSASRLKPSAVFSLSNVEKPLAPALIIPAARKNVWLNISASVDANMLNEPVFAVLNPDSLLGSYGMTLGLSRSVERKHLEVEYGLHYSLKRIPLNLSTTSGNIKSYVTTQIVDPSYHFLQVPFHLKYHIRNQRKWHFYGGAGIDINMIVHASENFMNSSAGSSPPPASFGPSAEPNAAFKEDASHDGIFEGGSIPDNSYLTLSFMMGMQRHLSNGVSLFVQPQYQHHIFSKTFGPNNDKINVLSVRVGTKLLIGS